MISLTELKQYLQISDSSQDAFVQTCADNAISAVNDYCNRDFRLGTYTEYLNGNNSDSIFLRNTPINSITSISNWNDTDNDYTDIFTSPDTVSKARIAGCELILNGYTYAKGSSNIKIVYNGGYAPANTWITLTAYNVNDYVIYNNQLYICITANTDAVFTLAKWTLITNVPPMPKDIKGVCLEMAGVYYKNSYAGVGGGRLGLSSQNIGGQSSEGVSFDTDISKKWKPILDMYRVVNV